MEVYEITGNRTGIARDGVNFLEPADSYQNMFDGYVYRQILQSRLGFQRFELHRHRTRLPIQHDLARVGTLTHLDGGFGSAVIGHLHPCDAHLFQITLHLHPAIRIFLICIVA